MFSSETLSFPDDLDDYFKEYADTIGYIHLADARELGIKPNQHGVYFTDERHHIMTDILEKYKYYGLSCDICLEVTETDYLTREHFKDDLLDVYVTCKKMRIPVDNNINL